MFMAWVEIIRRLLLRFVVIYFFCVYFLPDKVKGVLGAKKIGVLWVCRKLDTQYLRHCLVAKRQFYGTPLKVQFCPMSSTQTMKRKKDLAKLLYTKEGVTVGKELSERTGVSAQTISKWINGEGWEHLRISLVITKESELRRYYAQIKELNDAIEGRETGRRYPSSTEADTISKLTKAVKELETQVSVAEAIEVMKNFVMHVRESDFEQAKAVMDLGDAYIKSLM